MPANFPTSPTNGQTYNLNGAIWQWNGRAWQLISTAVQTGATGATGVAGSPGSAGATGSIGATGVAGSPGSAGATGVAGSPGSAGATGSIGATGVAGSPGSVGATGLVGATGAAGTPGTGLAIGGTDTQVQFNDSGSFGGDAGLTYNKTTDALTAAGTVTATKLVPTGNVTAGNGLYLPTTNTLAFGTNGTEAMRIDSSGNLGLGVTPSAFASSVRGYELGSAGTAQASWSITASGYMDIFRNAYIAAGGISTYKYNGYASQYRQDPNGPHVWQVAPSGTAGNAITFTQVLSVDRAKTLALEGASTQTGTGITFPATQSASSDANTLDDYEEGTFTPTFGSSNGTIVLTYASQTGTYTKIGNICKYVIYIAASGGVTAGPQDGILQIRGLPFTSKNFSGTFQDSVTIGLVESLSSYGTSTNTLSGLIVDNNTLMQFYNHTNATAGTSPSPAQIQNGTKFRVSGVYTVA